MQIKDFEVDVDFEAELEVYFDRFDKAKFRGDKLQACSPFRDEAHPSFAVNLETGVYIDSGCSDDEWRQGNFIKLLAYLRNETYHETEDFLLHKYRMILDDVESLVLDWDEIDLVPPVKKIYPLEALRPFCFDVNYLDNRNISPKVKKAFRAGYDPQSKAIVLPVMDKVGNIVNMKFRKIQDKIFWYDKEGQPVKQHLYGLNYIIKQQQKVCYIVEGEIDALYLWSLGIPAIATFGASLSKTQRKLILSSPIETIVIAADNDEVGKTFGDYLEFCFMGIKNVQRLWLPDRYKDVNEVPPDKADKILKKVVDIELKLW